MLPDLWVQVEKRLQALELWRDRMKARDTIGLRDDGWTPDSDPWVYVSATSFKIEGKDRRSRFGIGTRVKYSDGATDYGTAISAALSGSDTLVTLAANSDYAIANATLSGCSYSYGNPPDYPGIFNYTPAQTGLTTPAISSAVGQFAIAGPLITAWYYLYITSWASQSGAIRIKLPVAASTTNPINRGVGSYYRAAGSAQAGTHQIQTDGSIGGANVGYQLNDASNLVQWEASSAVVLTGQITYRQ